MTFGTCSRPSDAPLLNTGVLWCPEPGRVLSKAAEGVEVRDGVEAAGRGQGDHRSVPRVIQVSVGMEERGQSPIQEASTEDVLLALTGPEGPEECGPCGGCRRKGAGSLLGEKGVRPCWPRDLEGCAVMIAMCWACGTLLEQPGESGTGAGGL